MFESGEIPQFSVRGTYPILAAPELILDTGVIAASDAARITQSSPGGYLGLAFGLGKLAHADGSVRGGRPRRRTSAHGGRFAANHGELRPRRVS